MRDEPRPTAQAVAQLGAAARVRRLRPAVQGSRRPEEAPEAAARGRPGARLPQFRTVDVAVTDAIPFAVVDVEGAPPDPGEERDAAAAAAAAAEAYRVKTWPASALSGETCVEVRVRFARAKTRSEQELV